MDKSTCGRNIAVEVAVDKIARLIQITNPQLIGNMVASIWDATYVCHALAKQSGWWNGVDATDPMVFGAKLCLVHSEVSEALEGGRKGLMDSHLPHRKAEEVELADTLIRIFDLAGARKLDLAGAMIEKLAYNQQRADHKPEHRAAEGGKKI